MIGRNGSTLTLAALTLLAASIPGRAQTLDIKPGLWETTAIQQVGGMPAIDTSKMTPEQRTRVEAALKGRMGGGTPTTTRSCLTREKLDKMSFQELTQRNASCTNSVVSRSTSLVEMSFECADKSKSSGNMRFEATSRESMKGTVKITGGDAAHPFTMNMNMTAKWLGDSCGDVK